MLGKLTEEYDHHRQKRRNHAIEHAGEPDPGCCGVCELGTAKMVGGKIAAWLTGTMLPIAFRIMRDFMSGGCHM